MKPKPPRCAGWHLGARCINAGTVSFEGAWWCKKHNPESVRLEWKQENEAIMLKARQEVEAKKALKYVRENFPEVIREWEEQ